MKPLGWIALLLGILFLIVSFIYFTTPARLLPGFFPGFDLALTKIHRTHAIASFVLALFCFAIAWFQTGKKSSKK